MKNSLSLPDLRWIYKSVRTLEAKQILETSENPNGSMRTMITKTHKPQDLFQTLYELKIKSMKHDFLTLLQRKKKTYFSVRVEYEGCKKSKIRNKLMYLQQRPEIKSQKHLSMADNRSRMDQRNSCR